MPESPGAFHAELRFIPVRSADPGIPPTLAINPGPGKYSELILAFLQLQDRPDNNEVYGTRVIYNPRGYAPNALNPDFRSDWIVEI